MPELNIESGDDAAVAPKGLKNAIEFNVNYTLKDPNHDEIKDGYGLNWVGKNYAKLVSGLATETVVIPDVEHNAEPLNTDSQNVFLTGDNLDVLKHLQNAYTSKVDMIYIDPPYNTGSDGFVYPDNFKFTNEQLKNTLGLTDAEVQKVKNIEGKASHSAWLTFMYPRLFIAKRLLKETGVIFISIDDNEQANLKLLCDEVFGEGNFVGEVFVVNNLSGRSDDEYFATAGEYLLCYARSIQHTELFGLPPTGDYLEEFNKEDSISRYKEVSLQKTGKNNRRQDRPNMYYPIYYCSDTEAFSLEISDQAVEIYPTPINNVDGRWRWGAETFNQKKDTELVAREVNGNWRVYVKMRDIVDGEIRTIKAKSVWLDPKFDTGAGNRRLIELLGKKDYFTNPKPPEFIKEALKISANKNSLILDFFAGSGTTADAVMQLNSEDGGNRKWILCTIPEITPDPSEARNAGFNTIDEISRERIRRAGQKILAKYEKKEAENSNEGTLLDPAINAMTNDERQDPIDGGSEVWNKDIGFKHFRVVTPDVNTIDRITEFDPETNAIIAEDMLSEFGDDNASGCDTILTTYLLDDGYELTHSPDEIDIAGYKAYYIADSVLYLISQDWGAEQTKELLNLVGTNKLNLNTIVIYGYSFTFESLRELELNVKQSLDKTVSVEKRY